MIYLNYNQTILFLAIGLIWSRPSSRRPCSCTRSTKTFTAKCLAAIWIDKRMIWRMLQRTCSSNLDPSWLRSTTFIFFFLSISDACWISHRLWFTKSRKVLLLKWKLELLVTFVFNHIAVDFFLFYFIFEMNFICFKLIMSFH